MIAGPIDPRIAPNDATSERAVIGAVVRELLDAALAYAEAGIPLVRVHYVKGGACSCPKGSDCPPNKAGKHPLGAAWQDAATLDAAVVRSWWRDRPWNIGTVVRTDGDVTVLDVEGPDGHEIDGRPSFARLAAGLDLSAFPRSQTPSGGFHVWGRRPEEIDKLTDPAPGVEVFGEGAGFKMVILPPSSTLKGQYEWLTEGFEPEELSDLRPFPAQLWNGAPAPGSPDPKPVTTATPPVARHDLMLRIAGAMRRHGASAGEILAALQAMRRERGWDDKSDDELARVARDIGAKPDGETAAALSRARDLAEQLTRAVGEGDLAKAGRIANTLAREAHPAAPPPVQAWRPIAEALAEPDPELAPFWPGLVFRGAFSLFAAAPKAGKTWLLLAWVAALVRGASWLGFASLGRTVRVLLVTEEPLFIVKAQARLFGIERNVDVLTLDGIAPGTSWSGLVEAAAERAAETGAELALFDTVSTLAGMEDENSASDVNAALRPLLMAAREHDLAVVGVHHAAKSGGIRGSTVFEAVPDVLVEIGLNTAAPRQRVLRVRSRLEGAPERPVTVEWRPPEGDLVAGYRLAGSRLPESDDGEKDRRATLDLDARILREVAEATADGGARITSARIVERIGSAAGRIRGRLPVLVESGRLVREDGPGHGGPYVYGVPDGSAEPVTEAEPVPNLSREPVQPVRTCPSPVPCGSEAGSPNLSNLSRGAVSPRTGTGASSQEVDAPPGYPRAELGFGSGTDPEPREPMEPGWLPEPSERDTDGRRVAARPAPEPACPPWEA